MSPHDPSHEQILRWAVQNDRDDRDREGERCMQAEADALGAALAQAAQRARALTRAPRPRARAPRRTRRTTRPAAIASGRDDGPPAARSTDAVDPRGVW